MSPEGSDVAVRDAVLWMSPASDLVRVLVARGRIGLEVHSVGVREGADDAVHQLRVSCRRLRSDLRTFRPIIADARLEPLRTELKWLAGGFGAARDLEVLQGVVRDLGADLDVEPVLDLLKRREDAAVEGAIRQLDEPRYADLLAALRLDLQFGTTDLCADVVPALVDKSWHKLDKAVRRLHLHSPDEEWHEARKIAKRARYAAEAAQVAWDKGVGHRVKHGKKIQDLLGTQQDLHVAEEVLSGIGESVESVGYVCGRLAGLARIRATEIRHEFLKKW